MKKSTDLYTSAESELQDIILRFDLSMGDVQIKAGIFSMRGDPSLGMLWGLVSAARSLGREKEEKKKQERRDRHTYLKEETCRQQMEREIKEMEEQLAR